MFNSSAFNYTFEVAGGVEWFQTHTRSCRFEYRYHHLANTGNAAENPGIDSGGAQSDLIPSDGNLSARLPVSSGS